MAGERFSTPGWCRNLIQAGGMRPRERVLVVVDEPLVEEGSELTAAVREAGGAPQLELWIGERPLAGPPSAVAKLRSRPTSTSCSHKSPGRTRPEPASR